MAILLTFQIGGKWFAIEYRKEMVIEKANRKRFAKLDNFISIRSVLKAELSLQNLSEAETVDNFYLIKNEGHHLALLIPADIFKIDLESEVPQSGDTLIAGILSYKDNEITVISREYIMEHYASGEESTPQEKNPETVNGQEPASVTGQPEGGDMAVGANAEKEHAGADVSAKGSGADGIDEEKRDKIYQQIDIEVEKLKIKDFEGVEKGYLKGSKSFMPRIVTLYLVLILLTVAIVAGIVVLSSSQQAKLASDIKAIGNLESIIIKELQKKQEIEKTKLNEELKNVTAQLDSLQKDKDNYLKNQDAILKTKQQQLETDYQKKLDEQKALLLANKISKDDYDKMIKQINDAKSKELSDYQKQVEADKQKYLADLQKKQQELQSAQQDYTNKISQADAQISAINVQKQQVEQKLQQTEEEKQKAQQELEQMRQSSDLVLKMRAQLADYYKKILISYQSGDNDGLRRNLALLFDFLKNNKQAELLVKDEKDFNVFIINYIIEQVNRQDSDLLKKTDKMKYLLAAYKFSQSNNLTAAYENYYRAFTQYDVIVDKEETFRKDYETVIYKLRSGEASTKIESDSASLFSDIGTAFKNKDWNGVIALAAKFMKDYSQSSKITDVIEMKVQADDALVQQKKEQGAQTLYANALDLFNNGKYTESEKKLIELFRTYGGTSYDDQAADLYQKVDDKIKTVLMNAGQQGPGMSTAGTPTFIGLVGPYSGGDVLLFNVTTQEKVKAGDILQIYRKVNDTVVRIAIIEVVSLSNIFNKARILSVTSGEIVKQGDLVAKPANQ